METKKYYWLKLKNDFFTNKKIKKLRKIAGGDTYTIIYLKMQLLSITNEGKLYFDNVEDSFAEELALELDEDIENLKVTLMFLIKNGLLIEVNSEEYMLPETIECIGKESASAERVRKYRKMQREKQLVLQCNTPVTKSNIEKEKEKELEIELKKDKKKEISENIPKITTKEFIKPSINEVKQYCLERNNNINPEYFIDYYEANGWKVGKNPMKDWKAAIRTWEKRSTTYIATTSTKKNVKTEIIPEWLDKDIKEKEATEKEIKKMDKLLSRFQNNNFETGKTALQENLKNKYEKSKGEDQ